MDPFDVSYFAAVGAGVLTFLSPCILPLVPAYLCFISGMSLEELVESNPDDKSQRTRVLGAGLAFVLGLSSVFIALGATASSLGQVMASYKGELAMVAGAVIIIFGLHYMGVFRIGFLNFEKRMHLENKPAGWIGAFIIGMAFGFGWTPCVGPILSTILLIAGSGETVWYGISLLGVFAAGLGIPFLLAALMSGRFMRFLARFRKHLHKVEMAVGGFLVMTGVLILTGTLTDITGWLLETFPVLGGLN